MQTDGRNGFRKLITRALPEDKQKNELFIDEAVNQFSKAYQKKQNNSLEGILKLLESLGEEKELKLQLIPINEEIIPVRW